MKYYISEKFYCDSDFNIEKKVRGDIGVILKDMRFKELPLTRDYSRRGELSGLRMAWEHFISYRAIDEELSSLKSGDTLVFQLPVLGGAALLPGIFRSLWKRGVGIFAFIHDAEKLISSRAERAILKYCEGLVAYDEQSALTLINAGGDKKKIVTLEHFDYLLPDSVNGACGEFSLKEPVIITGDLSREKSGFIYGLPDNCRFRLYGSGYEGEQKRNVHYAGSFSAEDTPFVMVGSFGFVSEGAYELSLFLAAGIPVIVRTDSPESEFVISKECGFTIDSMEEISFRIKSMSEKHYLHMRENAIDLGIPLRDGSYTRRAIARLGL